MASVSWWHRGWLAAWVVVLTLTCDGQELEGVHIRAWSLDRSELMLRIATDVDRRYRIEVSTNLVDWATERITVPIDGTLANLFVPAPPVEARFYRVSVFRHEELRVELAAARARWASRGLNRYSFEMRWICHCPFWDWVRVVVDGNQVVEVLSVATGESLPPGEWGGATTMDGLFAHIEAKLDQHAVEARAVFDAESGYPVSAFSDLSLLIADDETGFEVRSFQP